MTALPPARRDPPRFPARAADHDGWFVWRNLLALWIALAYAAKALLLHASTVANFAPPEGEADTLSLYVAVRGVFTLFACGIYLYSYLRDWHFRTVAWIFVAVPSALLILDWLRVYVFVMPQPATWIAGLIGLRVLAIGCLVLNALNAHRAPPMPRSLWR